MLSTIARFLRGSERVSFTISREATGHIRILLQPVLGPAPDDLDETAQQLRAAMAAPLIITTTETELDQVVPELIARAATARVEVASCLEDYTGELTKLADTARKNAETKAAKKATDKPQPSSTPPTLPSSKTSPESEAAPIAPAAGAEPAVNLFEDAE